MADNTGTSAAAKVVPSRATFIRARVSKPKPEFWVNDVLYLCDTHDAMDAVLLLLELGLARIESDTDEFCFGGLRYSIGTERDYCDLVNVIGWQRVREAIASAEIAR